MQTSPPPVVPARSARDVRLDFARGLSMFIIFVAHVPANSWFLFIPARFGFSSAAELFVFCSGLASGYAFGGAYLRTGFREGTLRVLRRVAQVYGAHLGLIAGLAGASYIGFWLLKIDYPGLLGMQPLLADPASGLVDILLLRFVFPYTDILPLYIVLLAMIPVVMALAGISRILVFVGIPGLWLLANLTGLNLQANGAGWFFNPLAWQLLFFAGFGFGMGWLPAPRLNRGWLFWLCLTGVLVSIPLNFWAILEIAPGLDAIREAILPPGNQSFLSPLRFGHFLMLAYVALVLVDPYRAVLARAQPIIRVGQQSLATFITSTVLIWVAGMVLDWTGRDALPTALVNLSGFGVIIAVAYIAAFLKAPSKRPGNTPPRAAADYSRQVA